MEPCVEVRLFRTVGEKEKRFTGNVSGEINTKWHFRRCWRQGKSRTTSLI